MAEAEAIGKCRCEVCDCDQDDGRNTVSEQGVQRVTSKSKKETAKKQAEGPLRQTNTGAHENLTKGHRLRKTSARRNARQVPKIQNQHCQRVRTVVDSFLELLLVLRSVDMAGVYTLPRFDTSHRNTDTHQQVSINFTRESINTEHPSQLASPGQYESWMNCFVTRDLICVSPT